LEPLVVVVVVVGRSVARTVYAASGSVIAVGA
jgi:hypothetical protein